LSFYITQDKLQKLFAPFGQLASVNLVFDPRTKRPKGYGFVSYNTEIEAEKALKAMNGRVILSHLYPLLFPFTNIIPGTLSVYLD
ncbi:hypothetical protein LR48_Vigan05g187400, partial [Vigna angularis]